MEKQPDNTKFLLLNNEPIEEYLHVIVVVSNPVNYNTRYKLAEEFIKRMEDEPNCILYVVELAYNDQEFKITSADNKRHLQLRGTHPLWHKENMINLGVKYLLPKDWKAVAWIDADVEFDSPHWAKDALKLLNNGRDFIQLFSHAVDMDARGSAIVQFTGAGYQHCKKENKFVAGGCSEHPGFAWACNRTAYDKLGGLFEYNILGGGDNIMCNALIKNASKILRTGLSKEFNDTVIQYQNAADGLIFGYVPGSIRHHYHGKRVNRNYNNRTDILINYNYVPSVFVEHDDVGLLVPTKDCPEEFLKDVVTYFSYRKEDDLTPGSTPYKRGADKDITQSAAFFNELVLKGPNLNPNMEKTKTQKYVEQLRKLQKEFLEQQEILKNEFMSPNE